MSYYVYNCDKCGFENEIPESVVVLCNEHYRNCEKCGKRAKFKLNKI